MSLFSRKPWWKDREDGWHGKGVKNFFDESKKFYMKGDIATAIEILEWGKQFSLEIGSGGAVSHFEEMVEKLQDA